MQVCGVFFFQAEDGIRDLVRSRGLGDVYKRQVSRSPTSSRDFRKWAPKAPKITPTAPMIAAIDCNLLKKESFIQ